MLRRAQDCSEQFQSLDTTASVPGSTLHFSSPGSVQPTLTFLLALILCLGQRHKCPSLQTERECDLELHLTTQEFGLVTLEATSSKFVFSLVGRRPYHYCICPLSALRYRVPRQSVGGPFHSFPMQGLPFIGGSTPDKAKPSLLS